MERLAEKVYTNGCINALYKRGKRACIYIGYGGRYEVFLIRSRPEEFILGKMYPEREVYPPTSQWDKTAWTYIKLTNALKHFKKLENQ